MGDGGVLNRMFKRIYLEWTLASSIFQRAGCEDRSVHMKFSFAHFTEDQSDWDRLDKEGSLYTDDEIMD